MANDTIGSMTAVVRATAGQFAADMKKIDSAAASTGDSLGKDLGGGAKSASFSLGGLVAKLASAAAVIGLLRRGVSETSDAMERIEKLGKISNRLDIDPKVFRGWQFGSEQAGLGVDTLAKSVTT